ncbi:MAG: MogA/MoaB family molybdenum cofactor biosynthesis protein [Nitrospirota bacterium]|nr:MogA/MoaB family molybdenum cofactor biosynthesis protein [Nitrospirota bacterium]
MAHKQHKEQAKEPVGAWVVTCSDTRTEDTDESGALVRSLLEKDGHTVTGYSLVKDEPATIRQTLATAAADAATRVVLINGGTGISPRDSTYEVVASMLDKRIDGFGELFRHLSFLEIGSAAMMSRAVAGVAGRVVIVAMPGSRAAVRLAMEELVLPELRHMAWLLKG